MYPTASLVRKHWNTRQDTAGYRNMCAQGSVEEADRPRVPRVEAVYIAARGHTSVRTWPGG